jgi:hypothetical protein
MARARHPNPPGRDPLRHEARVAAVERRLSALRNLHRKSQRLGFPYRTLYKTWLFFLVIACQLEAYHTGKMQSKFP